MGQMVTERAAWEQLFVCILDSNCRQGIGIACEGFGIGEKKDMHSGFRIRDSGLRRGICPVLGLGLA